MLLYVAWNVYSIVSPHELPALTDATLTDTVPPEGFEVPEGWSEGEPIVLGTTLGRALFNEALPADYPFVRVEGDGAAGAGAGGRRRRRLSAAGTDDGTSERIRASA